MLQNNNVYSVYDVRFSTLPRKRAERMSGRYRTMEIRKVNSDASSGSRCRDDSNSALSSVRSNRNSFVQKPQVVQFSLAQVT